MSLKSHENVVLSLAGRPLTPPSLTTEAHQLAESNLATAQANYTVEPNLENTIWYGRRLAYLFRYTEAITVFSAGLMRFPRAHELLRHRGHRYISTRQFDKAATDLEHATALAAAQPVQVEADGIPNQKNQPTSNSHFNIWYHLGLAYYLLGQWQTAVSAYQTCLQYADNPDSLTATVDWLYMTHRRLGNEAEAQKLLNLISEDMDLVESPVYHNRLLMYKGLRTPESLLHRQEETPESTDIALATQGYGVGNWYLYNGEPKAAKAIFERVLQSRNWSAFGYIAAEVELNK